MVSEIAHFISTLNSVHENHVGYCGTEFSEIQTSILDFETPLDDAFVLLKESGKITGLMGFDIDSAKKEAEVWGPSIHSSQWQEKAEVLWQEAQKKLGPSVRKFNFFFETRNKRAIDFALKLGATQRSENSILVLNASQRPESSGQTLSDLTNQHTKAFINLHDSLFSSAYLSGQQIVDIIDEHNRVLILERDQELAGYIYIEVDPNHNESTIHFFGVHEKHRGKGFGQQLLSAGVALILGFDQIHEIILCVDSQNQQAIRLYERIGFFEKHKCIHFVLTTPTSE